MMPPWGYAFFISLLLFFLRLSFLSELVCFCNAKTSDIKRLPITTWNLVNPDFYFYFFAVGGLNSGP
jgi:hypothetical protein